MDHLRERSVATAAHRPQFALGGHAHCLVRGHGGQASNSATAVGGVRDVLPESVGWWAPPENPAALIAEAMRAAMSDRSRATARGLRAEERLREEYDGEILLSRYEDVYYGACPRRSRQ